MPKKTIMVRKKSARKRSARSGSGGPGSQAVSSNTKGEDVSITQQVVNHPETLAKRTQELRESPYIGFLNSVYDCVFITGMDGIIQEVNARAEEKLHVFRNEFQGRQITDLIVGADSSLMELLREKSGSKSFTVLQADCMRDDKTTFRSEIVATRFLGDEENRLCFFIREVEQRDDENGEADAQTGSGVDADALKRLINEFNNPLQVMLCMTELANQKQFKPHLSRIMQVLNRLRALADGEEPEEMPLPEVPLEPSNPNCLLIVSTEEVVGQLFAKALESSFPQVEIETATDLASALALFERLHHGVLIVDVDSSTGAAVYRRLEQLCAKQAWAMSSAIFCVSGELPDEMADRVGEGASNTCLQKPFETQALVKLVRDRLPFIAAAEVGSAVASA